MLRLFDFQVNLSTDQGRIKEIEVTARMTDNQEVIVEQAITLTENRPDFRSWVKTRYGDVTPTG
jgi:hypothetical protein